MTDRIKYSDTVYSMKRKNVGKAYIFNNENFDDPDWQKREGTNYDAQALQELLTKMHFTVEKPFKDFTREEASKKIDEIAEQDFSEDNCFLAVFLSHGDTDNVFMKDKDKKLPIQDEILKPFRGNNCKSLAGKPKIFIFQTCRGRNREEEASNQVHSDTVEDASACQDVEEDGTSSVTPAGADFVVCYAAAKGYVSFRNVADGSWFIQSLVRVFKNYFNNDIEGGELDFLSLMTIVSNKVAQKFEMDKGKKKLQVPCTVSTLTKRIYLKKGRHEERVESLIPSNPIQSTEDVTRSNDI